MVDYFTIFTTAAVIIILVLGTIGNILVVLVVSRRRRMRTVTNYFILNLAIADLTVLISNIPVDLTSEFSKKWIFGKEACKVILPLQTMGTIASILTLAAISLSRYHAVVYPFHRQMKLRHARGIIVAIWIISIAGITPYSLAYRYEEARGIPNCTEDFESVGMSSKAYTLTQFFLQYVVPMAGMTYAYNRIGSELNHPQTNDGGSLMDAEYRRESRKVVKMLSIVVVVFAVLVLPIHIVWIWIDFGDAKSEHPKILRYIKGLALIMLYGNSFINPIIYSVCNDQFRTGFKELSGSCLRPCCFIMNVARTSKSEGITYSGRRNNCHSTPKGNVFRQKGVRTQNNNGRISTSNMDCTINFNNNGISRTSLPRVCRGDITSHISTV